MAWVGFQLPARGMDGEVHVLHGHRPQQDVIAKHQCPDEAEAVLEGHLHWSDVGNAHRAAIGPGDLPLRLLLQLQRHRHGFRDAEHPGTRAPGW
jgi:hypothetical protein